MRVKKYFLLLLVLIFSYVKSQNGNSSVIIKDALGNTSANIDCSYPLLNDNRCLALNATFPDIKATETYIVSSEAYSPNLPLNSGTAIDANYDDYYGKKIDIPFDFCFFGNSYNQLVIGSNGVVTFDVSQLNNICFPNIQSTIPSSLLPHNSIFGVLNDMVFSTSDDSEIYYYVAGAAPYRKLVVTFYKGRISGCTDYATSQIVLSEGTNEIEVFVENKPQPCGTAKFRESLIGLQNIDGSLGYAAPGRNTSVWSSSQEAWKFTPSGAVLTPKLVWTNSANEEVGNTANITVCPPKKETYTLTVTYPICGKSTYTISGQFNVDFSPFFPLASDYTKLFCIKNNTAENINLDDYKGNVTPQNPANFIFTYYLTLADAQNATNPQSPNVSINNDTTYYVRIENPTDHNCYRIGALKFKFDSLDFNTKMVSVCDSNNDNLENNYPLANFNSQLLPSGFSGTITYFQNQSDAQNNTNSLTNLNINPSTTFWVRFDNGQCNYVFGPISINFVIAPIINTTVVLKDYETCDNHADGLEPFSWRLITDGLITTDKSLKISFYATYQEAFSGAGTPVDSIMEGINTVYARVEDPYGCFSIATITMRVIFSKVLAEEKNIYVCFDGTQDITVDLKDYAPTMLISPLTANIGYYDLYYNSVVQFNPLTDTKISITQDGNFVTKTFYIRFTNEDTKCYTVRKLIINLVHPIPEVSTFEICDSSNNNIEKVDFSPIATQVVGSQNAVATFHLNMTDAQAGTNSLSNYNVTGGQVVYARITSYACTEIYPITFKLNRAPTLVSPQSILLDKVCDNNGDGTEYYDLTQNQSAIYTGILPVSYTYYSNYDNITGVYSGLISDPTHFPVKQTADAYVVVQFNDTGCYSVGQIHVQMNFLPIIKLHKGVLKACDHEFDLKEKFYLSDAISQMFLQAENTTSLSDFEITYYNSEDDANAGLPATQISDQHIALVSNEIVWARFESKVTHCYSITPINLLTYLPPKAINYNITGICDNNLDGVYDINLMSYTNNLVNVPDPENNFTFYLSYNDVLNGTNPIANPTNFSMDPFPKQIWVKIENIPGCNDFSVLNTSLGTKLTLKNSGPFALTVCDDKNDGGEFLDLTQFESQIYGSGAVYEYYLNMKDLNNENNKILDPTKYAFIEGSSSAKIFVKITAKDFCPTYVEINIALKKVPIFSLPDYFFCPYYNSTVDIEPDFSKLDIAHYEWIAPDGTVIVKDQPYIKNINTVGKYTLNVIGTNGCTYSTTFNVTTYDVPVITRIIPGQNKYTIEATGNKKILYSIDGKNWQKSNVFENLENGIYTFYVKYEDENCVGLTKQGIIFSFTNTLTPNSDGVNDTWDVDNINVFEGKTATLEIYDKFGKKVYSQESSTKLSWGGQWGGSKAPTGTYWYVVKTPDGRIMYGWLFLKNRD